MKKINVFIVVGVLILFGCTSTSNKFNFKNYQAEIDKLAEKGKISDSNKMLMLDYIAIYKTDSASIIKLSYADILTKGIEKQQGYYALIKRVKATKTEIDSILIASLIKKYTDYTYFDSKYNKRFDLNLNNNGTKKITAFTVIIHIENKQGEILQNSTWNLTKVILPGSTIKYDGLVASYDKDSEVDRKFEATDLKFLKVKTPIYSIIFEDGSTLGFNSIDIQNLKPIDAINIFYK
jgi:hypothetical protein